MERLTANQQIHEIFKTGSPETSLPEILSVISDLIVAFPLLASLIKGASKRNGSEK